MKVKKIILTMVSTLILCAMAFGQTAYAATNALPELKDGKVYFVSLITGVNYDINYEEGKQYALGNNIRLINKIGLVENPTASEINYSKVNDAYCAKAGQGFEYRDYIDGYNYQLDDLKNGDTYINFIDKYISRDELADGRDEVNTGWGDNYNNILRLTDLFYLENDNFETYKNGTLKEALKSNPELWVNLGGDANYSNLADADLLNVDQIKAIQQAALWYFTNSDDNNYHKENLEIFCKENNEGIYKQIVDETDVSYLGSEANALYKYLIETAKVIPTGNTQRDTKVYFYTNASSEIEKENTQPVIVLKREKKEFDLALRKYITEVKDKDGNTIKTYNDAKNRVPDTSSEQSLTGEGLKDGEQTAKKEHIKDPVTIKKGNRVVYTIRIYNEGEVDGYAKQVTDYLPEGLELVPQAQSTINTTYNWTSTDGKRVTTDYLENVLIPAANRDWSKLDDKDSNENPIYYRDLLIECKVNSKATSKNLKNIAEITESTGKNGEKDTDSDAGNVTTDTDNYNKDGKHKTTGRGEEDDDDFEDLKINFDLALRKYITKVEDANGNNISIESRVPNVDESTIPLTTGTTPTTATYKHKKDPVSVQNGYYVYYTLSIYNEGDVDGNATQITDQLPAGLVAQRDGIVSDTFEFESYDTTNNVLVLKRKSGVAVQQSYEEGKLNDYKETVTVKCKVDTKQSGKIFTNIAWISEYYEKGKGVVTSDLDSQSTTPSTKPSKEGLVTDEIGYINEAKNRTKTIDSSSSYFEGQQDDDDFEKIRVANFDLALRKFITKITTKSSNYTESTDYTSTREPSITGETVGEETTAEKKHDKTPLQVAKGDKVEYTIRIYNEGDVDGYASKVIDYLPDGLTFQKLADGNGFTNVYIVEEKTDSNGKKYLEFTMNPTTPTILKAVGGTANFEQLTNNDYYTDIKIECIVNDSATKDNLKNVAEITETKDKDGNTNPTEPDSTPNDLTDNEKKNPERSTSENGKGWEDDDDYEDLKLVELDLALRKFITRVADNPEMTNATEYDRAPTVSQEDVEKLFNGEITTANYNHTKKPLKVNVRDYVEYTLRVYNEGSMEGYAREITDHLPEYLEYVKCEANETTYKWNVSEDGRTVTTDYLKDTKLDALKRVVHSVSETTGIPHAIGMTEEVVMDSTSKLDELELKIICKVNDKIPYETNQTNIAEISKYGFSKKGSTQITETDTDRDSQTPAGNGGVVLPSDEDLPNYKKDEIDSGKSYIPGQQDDDDFEKIYVPKFDLALRKFITKVEKVNEDNTREDRYTKADYDARVPQISQESYEKLIKGETTTLEYTHSKEPMNTVQTDIVTYTLRVYNEGNMAGYASVITDDIPEGVVFLPEDATNVKYRWKMFEELPEGATAKAGKEMVELNINESSEVKKYVETDDVSKAKIIRTDYLSRENGATENKIKALDKENRLSDANPDYRDVQVAFKVVEPYRSDRIIINYAQISKDQDEDGDEVTDIDSHTDEWIKDEDDQDIEKIRVPQFDLALRKWVTQAIVTENGETTVTETGHQPFDDPEEVVKVELHRKKLSNVTVKFRYSIRVYNDGYDKETGAALPGYIAGYAKEVKDHIPEGLKFLPEDNPDWKDEGNNIITTRKLENTLLKPGEFADVEVVLTWINGNDNLGLKINYAEISEDDNDWDVPDNDSTPDNMKERHEDDDDDAPVILSVSTGVEATYIVLGLSVLITIAGGIALIKKFVM